MSITESRLPVPSTPPVTRLCPGCEREVLAEHCRPMHQSGQPLRLLCPECHEEETTKAKALLEYRQRIEAFRREFIAAFANRSLSAPTIADLATKLVEEFGGMEEVCRLWKEQIHAAIERSPGSSVVLRSLESLGRIIDACSQYTGRLPDVMRMTDDELKQQQEAIEQILANAVRRIRDDDRDD